MNKEEYIKEIVNYLKDDRPMHAYASMKSYLESLGYPQPMQDEQWHLDRMNGIGGSEASIVLGFNPWKNRLQLYHEKVYRKINVSSQDNIIFEIGHLLEPMIANHYSKMTKRVLESRPQKTHPEYPFITGNVDRVIVKSEKDTPGILEIKTKGAFVNWDNEEIPPYYMAQLQQYLSVYAYKWGSFAVLDLGKREITYTDVERDDSLINKIIEEEKKFWNLVQNKTPPEIEYTKQTEEFLKEYFNQAEQITIDVSDNIEASKKAGTLKFIKNEIKNLEEQESEHKTYFMNLMKEAERLIGNKYNISWKNDQDSTKFNVEKFKLENPTLYKNYLEPKKGVRRFLFKHTGD